MGARVDVPAKYVHLSGRDLDDANSKLHGLKPEEEDEHGPRVVRCTRCAELNDPEDRFCGRCGQALDVNRVEELETAEEKVMDSPEEKKRQLALEIAEVLTEDEGFDADEYL